MTQKELSYLEDAIKHEQNLAQICDNVVNNLTDEELIAFIKTELLEEQIGIDIMVLISPL